MHRNNIVITLVTYSAVFSHVTVLHRNKFLVTKPTDTLIFVKKLSTVTSSFTVLLTGGIFVNYLSSVYLLCYVCIAAVTLDAGLLASSQYPEGPATGHLDTGFSWFPSVYKRMLRWIPSFQVATTCLSCSPPD